MSKLLKSYFRVLEKHPLITMSCTTGTLMATGDAISQLVVERTHKFDVVRNGRFLVFGVFIGGPMFRGWYYSIDKIFGKTKYAPMKMMIADQKYLSHCQVYIPVKRNQFVFTFQSKSKIQQCHPMKMWGFLSLLTFYHDLYTYQYFGSFCTCILAIFPFHHGSNETGPST
nr:protein Mpv17 isoform X4 [Crassostrea gigas]